MSILTTYDLLKPVFDGISKTFKVKGIVDNNDGTYTINSCNTLWAMPGFPVVINMITYKILAVEQDEWIKIEGLALPSVEEFEIYDFHFLNNTVLAQDRVTSNIPVDLDKFPMIWLHEVTPNDNFPSGLSAIERVADVDIYFLAPRNISDWERPEDEKYVIKPMRYLMNAFVEQLQDTPSVYREKLRHRSYDHANFGDYIPKKGYPENLFNDNTSGTQFSGQIQFFKVGECANCC